MSHAKKDAINTINNLPDEASWDDIMYELYVAKKVNQAREQVAKGEFINHDEARKRLMKS